MAGGYGVSVAVASAWLITLSSGVSLVASPTAKVPGCTMVTSKYALSCKTGESPRMDPWPETSFPCTCTPPALSLSLNPITGSNATSGGSGTPQQQPMTCTDESMQVWSKLTWERSGWTLRTVAPRCRACAPAYVASQVHALEVRGWLFSSPDAHRRDANSSHGPVRIY